MENDAYFWAYLAGLIDGDGSFIVSIDKAVSTRINFQMRPRISIGLQANEKAEEVFAYIKNKLQFGCYYKSATKRGVFEYFMVKGMHLEYVSINLLPYLILKKETCKKFLVILDKIRRGNHLTVDGFIELCYLRDELNRGSRYQSKNRHDAEWYAEKVEIKPPKNRSDSTKSSWDTRRERYGHTGYTKEGYMRARKNLLWDEYHSNQIVQEKN